MNTIRTKNRQFVGAECSAELKEKLQRYSKNKNLSESGGLRDILTTFFSLSDSYGAVKEKSEEVIKQ